MPIAFTPLIPLNRVQADPQARFQRFGANDSRLFGKPISVAPEAASGSQRPRFADRAQPKRADEAETGPWMAAAHSAMQAVPDRPRGYPVPAERPSRTATPWLGANLDVVA